MIAGRRLALDASRRVVAVLALTPPGFAAEAVDLKRETKQTLAMYGVEQKRTAEDRCHVSDLQAKVIRKALG